MGRSAMLNEPSFLLCADTSRFVASARALTLAPCTTAPLLSVTVPFIEPSVCCPVARGARHIKLAEMPATKRQKTFERREQAEKHWFFTGNLLRIMCWNRGIADSFGEAYNRPDRPSSRSGPIDFSLIFFQVC